MKKTLNFMCLAAFWMPLVNGYAQAPSVREYGPVNMVRADARTADNPGIWKQVIENHGLSALVAFHATFDCGRGGHVLYDHDPLFFYGRDMQIPSTGNFEIQAADPSVCPGGIDAAIFADGHTEGDPVQIEAILERRRGINEAIGSALPLLQKIAANKETSLQVQAAFSELEAAANHNHSLSGPERLGMHSLFQRLRLTLITNQGVLITPSDKNLRRPPDYSEIAATQNMSLEQTQASVIARKLQEWRADLEGSLKRAPVQ